MRRWHGSSLERDGVRHADESRGQVAMYFLSSLTPQLEYPSTATRFALCIMGGLRTVWLKLVTLTSNSAYVADLVTL